MAVLTASTLVASARPASAAPRADATRAPSVTPPSAEQASTAAPPPAIPPLVVPRHVSYRLPLAVLYTLAPFAAVGVGHGISRAGASDAVVALSAGVLFFAPAALHIAHGKPGHGVLSFLALAGLTTAGALVGGFIGGSIGQAQCERDRYSDGCELGAFPGVVYGAFIGGALSYAACAVYDVIENGSVLKGAASRDQALQLWMGLTPNLFTDHATEQPSIGGVQLGVLVPW